ncbi:MAG: DUF5110 domain-containing protein [candidate division KSB1 bacterium]|nr:DUF5110 domain-containing protein [candidate division KSB1 bacterium]
MRNLQTSSIPPTVTRSFCLFLFQRLLSILTTGFLFASTAFGQQFVGNYTGHAIRGDSVIFSCESASLLLEFCSESIIKVKYTPFGTLTRDTSFVTFCEDWPAVNFTVQNFPDSINFHTNALTLACRKRPFRLVFRERNGRLLLQERPAGGLGWDGGLRYAYFNQTADEHFYGFGERGISLDRKGYRFDTYNRPVFGYSIPLATMNINIPFFCSTRGYGIYFDNTHPGLFDMGAENPDYYSYRADAGEMIFYFIYGPDLKSILKNYTALTGRQPMPPRWALGYLQSKYGYRNETQAREMVNTMRQKKIPCDAIVLDLYWFGGVRGMGNMSWDTASWQNPAQMVRDFLAMGIKTILITEPYIVTTSSNYAAANARKYFGTNASGQALIIPDFWAGSASLLDLTNPGARAWWWSLHEPLMAQGVSGWWTDLGEPEVHPSEMQHQLGSAAKVHNIFNLLWSKSLFDGYSVSYPQQRVFNITRSGFAGMQRYSTFPWSGDVRSSFGGLAVQIPIMLGMGLSGVAYQHSDLSGFTGNPSPELYVRWMQLGAFSPIARAHGADGTHQTEPWAFGTTAEAIVKSLLQLRYRLLPYSYTLAYENHSTGVPIARPLVLEYPNDPNVYNLGNEYLWGPDFLVAPVTQPGVTSRSLYLPEGEWVDYWTDRIYSGGTTITANAPLETLPLFVKRGAVIPLQNEMNYSDEFPLDTLTLVIYPSRQSSFTLYADDGRTTAYRSGAFALTTFACEVQPAVVSVTIGRSSGDYSGKPNRRVYFCELHHISQTPDSVTKNANKLVARKSVDELRRYNEGWWYDSAKQLLVVKCQTVPDEKYVLRISGEDLVSSTTPQSELPTFFRLYPPHPNPFSETTQIAYRLVKRARVQVEIFNLMGQRLKSLVMADQQPGEYAFSWRGEDERDLPAAAGIYVVRVKVNAGEEEFLASEKISLLR